MLELNFLAPNDAEMTSEVVGMPSFMFTSPVVHELFMRKKKRSGGGGRNKPKGG